MKPQTLQGIKKPACRLLLAAAAALVFYLHLTALRAADDFYYATFWMNGPVHFWRLTLQHYQTFNGRALVHFVAQTVLAFPPVVFALINTALLTGAALLGAVDQGAEKGRLFRPVFFFLAALLLLPREIITEGLLWASASYNYMLPVFLTALALWFLSQFLDYGRSGPLFLFCFVLVQFSAGATTEQCGFLAITATGVYGLCWAIRTHRHWWKLFPAPLLAVAGWSTIFLSPATQNRAQRGASLEPDDLLVHLDRLGKALFSPDGLLLPLLLAAALLALCLLIPKVRKSLGRGTLSLLAGGAASLVVMIPTGNFDPRILLPAALILLLISARCAALLLELCKPLSFIPVLCGALTLGLCAALCSPLLTGATQNYALELQNRAAVRKARETGVLHYSIDYDTHWCYPSLMYTESTYYSRFLEANRLTGCTVYLESEQMKPVYLDGRQLFSPGYEQDGKVFFSLRDIIEGFGGTVEYASGLLTIHLDGTEVKFHPNLLASYSLDGKYAELNLSDKMAARYFKASYTADVYRTLWNIDITLEDGRYICRRMPAD